MFFSDLLNRTVVQYVRCHEDNELGFLFFLYGLREELTDEGYVAEQRDLSRDFVYFIRYETRYDDRLTVPDLDEGVHFTYLNHRLGAVPVRRYGVTDLF